MEARNQEDTALDLEFEATEADDEPMMLDECALRIDFEPSHRRIKDLFSDYKSRDLDPRPGFQRGYIWDRVRASNLIESVLLQVPIPHIYTAEEDDGREVVIDGQQRLLTFFGDIDGIFPDDQRPFKLSGLQIRKNLNHKSFTDLDPETRRAFERYTISIIKISRYSNPDVRFEIFHRLNTSSMSLSEQELRNCLFRGPFNELLRELATMDEFQHCLGTNGIVRRMADREIVLRFLAFYDRTYLHYPGRMKHFLNREMEERRALTEPQAEDFRNAFKKAVELSWTVFGQQSFRRFVKGDAHNPNGHWERPLNKARYDVIMWAFAHYEKRQIIACKESIREELLHLLTTDEAFLEAIISTTAAPGRVRTRFETWRQALERIVTLPKHEPRGFSLQRKAALFQRCQTCALCHQRIEELDDAEVDPVEEYWRGGRTIPENARLAHRFCNRSRRPPSR